MTTRGNPSCGEENSVPVQPLANMWVCGILAGGMGVRALQAFRQAGIQVFFAGVQGNVDDAIKAFLAGTLPPFNEDPSYRVCGGY